MRGFVLGVIITLVVVFGGAWIYLRLGMFNVSAIPNPGTLERHMANMAMDASVEKRASKGPNPVPLNDAVLIDAAKEYEEHCSMCHGSQNPKAMDFGNKLSPRAPNLLRHADDDPDGEIYWIIENGIRMTGMSAWKDHFSSDEMWGIVHLLKNVKNVSPAVMTAWQQAAEEREHVMPQPADQQPEQKQPAPHNPQGGARKH
jgi:mono/diheme cytochrome c family protein